LKLKYNRYDSEQLYRNSFAPTSLYRGKNIRSRDLKLRRLEARHDMGFSKQRTVGATFAGTTRASAKANIFTKNKLYDCTLFRSARATAVAAAAAAALPRLLFTLLIA